MPLNGKLRVGLCMVVRDHRQRCRGHDESHRRKRGDRDQHGDEESWLRENGPYRASATDTGLAWHGWKPSLVAIPGVIIGSMGPLLGVPDVDPIKAWMLGALIGAVLILGVSRFLRS